VATEAGWYNAPEEPGMLRYWSGDNWTDHRQPVPPVGPPVAVTSDAAMQPFEQQFSRTPAQPMPATPVPTAVLSPVQSTPWAQPQWPQQPQASALPPVASPFAHLVDEAKAAAANPAYRGLAEELGGAALAADGVVGFGPNRQGIGGAIKGMLVGLIFVAVGLGLIGYIASQGTVSAGEKEVSATVTGLGTSTSTDSNGSTSTSCAPDASFIVAGNSYTATTGVSTSPCSYSVGQSVKVIYDVADPTTAHVAMSSPALLFLWLFPIIGGLAFFGSLWTFIKRAGSIAGGIALVVDGRRRRREAAAAR